MDNLQALVRSLWAVEPMTFWTATTAVAAAMAAVFAKKIGDKQTAINQKLLDMENEEQIYIYWWDHVPTPEQLAALPESPGRLDLERLHTVTVEIVCLSKKPVLIRPYFDYRERRRNYIARSPVLISRDRGFVSEPLQLGIYADLRLVNRVECEDDDRYNPDLFIFYADRLLPDGTAIGRWVARSLMGRYVVTFEKDYTSGIDRFGRGERNVPLGLGGP